MTIEVHYTNVEAARKTATEIYKRIKKIAEEEKKTRAEVKEGP